LLALWAVLASQEALAHGSHERRAAPAKAQAAEPRPLTVKTAFAAPAVASKAAPLCPPGGSGHVCGCGNLSVCDGRAKSVVIAVFPSRPAAVRPAGRIASLHAAPAAARRPYSATSPRAPPAIT
jgi:hypothetical protein